MQAFPAIAMIFIIGGALGYLLELFYRRARHGKWINPGFLSGPFLPLYGVGTLLLFGICSLGDATFATTPWGKVLLILLITVAMTLAELVTGLIFAEGMKVRLWDYSGLWGNFRGIICPLFSLIWGAIGALYYFVLHRHLVTAVMWLSDNPFDTFIVGMFFGIFLVDLCYSFHVVTLLRALAKKTQSIIGFEPLKVRMRVRAKRLHSKSRFLFPFRNTREVENAVSEEQGRTEENASATDETTAETK